MCTAVVIMKEKKSLLGSLAIRHKYINNIWYCKDHMSAYTVYIGANCCVHPSCGVSAGKQKAQVTRSCFPSAQLCPIINCLRRFYLVKEGPRPPGRPRPRSMMLPQVTVTVVWTDLIGQPSCSTLYQCSDKDCSRHTILPCICPAHHELESVQYHWAHM